MTMPDFFDNQRQIFRQLLDRSALTQKDYDNIVGSIADAQRMSEASEIITKAATDETARLKEQLRSVRDIVGA